MKTLAWVLTGLVLLVMVLAMQVNLWSVGASITQTIFDGGRRRATSDAARASYDATVRATGRPP